MTETILEVSQEQFEELETLLESFGDNKVGVLEYYHSCEHKEFSKKFPNLTREHLSSEEFTIAIIHGYEVLRSPFEKLQEYVKDTKGSWSYDTYERLIKLETIKEVTDILEIDLGINLDLDDEEEL